MKSKLLLVIVAAMFAAGCGSPSKQSNSQQSGLNPQGNWLFTMQTPPGDSTGPSWSAAARLVHTPAENSPTIGGGALDAYGDCHAGSDGVLGLASLAEVTGTNSIVFNLTSGPGLQLASYTLTGTIAADEQSMSGTYVGQSPCGGIANPSGTWTAQLIPPITGTWSGTSQGETITLSVTENTDRTSDNMGDFTGTMTVTGNPCFGNQSFQVDGLLHEGEQVDVTATDSVHNLNVQFGQHYLQSGATTMTGSFVYSPVGNCASQTLPLTLTKQ